MIYNLFIPILVLVYYTSPVTLYVTVIIERLWESAKWGQQKKKKRFPFVVPI